MKRIITAILVLTVAAALLVLPAAAAGNSRIQLSSQALAEGDKLEITYFLSGYAQVDTIGITFSIPEGLKLESAEWLLEEGIIKNVNTANCQAAWANDKPLDLSEETAVLRITCIAEKSSAGGMQIDISAVVKKGSAEQGQTAAQAQVKPPMAASAVSLNKDTLSLDLNGTGTFVLTAKLSPAEATDKVVWSCDDSGVVKVSQDGTVTALKKGTAKVTATAGSASKSCTVTVTCSHDLKETPAKAPTCTDAGNYPYFTCKICGGYYASVNGQMGKEIALKDTVHGAAGHKYASKVTAPTCTEKGWTTYTATFSVDWAETQTLKECSGVWGEVTLKT